MSASDASDEIYVSLEYIRSESGSDTVELDAGHDQHSCLWSSSGCCFPHLKVYLGRCGRSHEGLFRLPLFRVRQGDSTVFVGVRPTLL